MSLSNRQRREIATAVKHIGRAMRALNRADLAPVPESGDRAAWAIAEGERRLGRASDRLIDGLES